MTIETLVQNFLSTFDMDPQTAEREITKGLVDLAGGDEDLYLSLRNQAAAQVSAALEARLRAEVSEANLAHEEALGSGSDLSLADFDEIVAGLEEVTEVVSEGVAD